MATKATNDALAVLHSAIAQTLTERIVSGEASAADISNAIKFLKDNGIEADPEVNTDVQSLAHQFPSFDDDADEAVAH
jgi:hypothetical protein